MKTWYAADHIQVPPAAASCAGQPPVTTALRQSMQQIASSWLCSVFVWLQHMLHPPPASAAGATLQQLLTAASHSTVGCRIPAEVWATEMLQGDSGPAGSAQLLTALRGWCTCEASPVGSTGAGRAAASDRVAGAVVSISAACSSRQAGLLGSGAEVHRLARRLLVLCAEGLNHGSSDVGRCQHIACSGMMTRSPSMEASTSMCADCISSAADRLQPSAPASMWQMHSLGAASLTHRSH